MANEVASAFVTLKPSAKGFGRGIEREIGSDVDRTGKRAGARFGTSMRTGIAGVSARIFSPLAVAAGAVALGGIFGSFIGEARESQKVGALTAQVIKTTGKAAHVSAGQVGDLATAISNKTGIDDEAIQSGANLLLTFTNVRNEAGKGNDVFNQATQTITDMSAALGQDAKGSAIQLGKALNDPVKGITALSRVGVSFTKQQKDQIATLVKSGDTLGAQKIILAELNREFGGAAAASATAGDKFRTTFDNFKESIGTALLPILDKTLSALTPFIAGLSEKVGPAFAAIGAGISGLSSAVGGRGAFKTVGETVGTLAAGLRALKGAFQEGDVTSRGFVGAMERVGVVARTIGNGIRGFFAAFREGDVTSGGFVGAMEQLGVFAKTKVLPAVQGVARAFGVVVEAVRGLVSVVLPIIQQFVAGMIARIKPFEPQIRATFSTVGQIITNAVTLIQLVLEKIAVVVKRVTAVITFVWNKWGSDIMSFTARVFGALFTIIGGALKIILGVIRLVIALIKGDWSGAWNAIKGILAGAWQVIKGIVSLGVNLIKGILGAAWAVIKAAALAVWDRLVAGVKQKMDALVANIRGLRQRILDGLGNLRTMLLQAGKDLIQGLIDGITSKIKAVGDAIGKVASKIAEYWPGSPIKTGPLKSWNRGGAGRRLGDLLADGLEASRSAVAEASARMASSVEGPGALAFSGAATAGVGVEQIFHGDIYANDLTDFQRQLAQKRRVAAYSVTRRAS